MALYKIKYQDDIRALRLTDPDISGLAQVTEFVNKTWGLTSFQLKYLDEDQDMITIGSQMEFNYATSNKIHVFRVEGEPSVRASQGVTANSTGPSQKEATPPTSNNTSQTAPSGPFDNLREHPFGNPFQGNSFQGNPFQGNSFHFQGNPFQGNPFQGNPFQGNPFQGNPCEGAQPPFFQLLQQFMGQAQSSSSPLQGGCCPKNQDTASQQSQEGGNSPSQKEMDPSECIDQILEDVHKLPTFVQPFVQQFLKNPSLESLPPFVQTIVQVNPMAQHIFNQIREQVVKKNQQEEKKTEEKEVTSSPEQPAQPRRWENEQAILQSLGFTDETLNLRALEISQGNVEVAIEALLSFVKE